MALSRSREQQQHGKGGGRKGKDAAIPACCYPFSRGLTPRSTVIGRAGRRSARRVPTTCRDS